MLKLLDGLVHHVVHDRLRREDIVDNGGHASHEPGATLERLFGMLLKLEVVWDDTLRREFLDLLLTVILPVCAELIRDQMSERGKAGYSGTYQSSTYGVRRTRSGRPV